MDAVNPLQRKRSGPGHPPRRRQADRSADTRRRLLDATIDCLAESGYAGATLARIVARAGVSRGAQVHHFGSRHSLMVEAAEDLLRRVYRDLGDLLLALPDPGSRLERTVIGAWEGLFSTPWFRAYQTLLDASHRDTDLADALSKLLERMHSHYQPAVTHYFEPQTAAVVKPATVFIQLACFLHGLAAQAHLARDPTLLAGQLRAYARLMSTQLKVRRSVRSPPPRARR